MTPLSPLNAEDTEIRRAPHDDAHSALVSAHDQGDQLTLNEVSSIAILLLAAVCAPRLRHDPGPTEQSYAGSRVGGQPRIEPYSIVG